MQTSNSQSKQDPKGTYLHMLNCVYLDVVDRMCLTLEKQRLAYDESLKQHEEDALRVPNLFESLQSNVAGESQRDLEEISMRFDNEGISFLTKTLPQYGKAFDRALQSGHLNPIQGLERAPGTAIPKLFGALLSCVFSSDGVLNPVHTDAIKHLRCLYYFLYKLRLPYDKETEAKLLASFVETDISLEEISIPLGHKATVQAQRLAADVFGCFDPLEIMPRHGPGVVATGERVHEKHLFSRIYAKLEKIYPFTGYFALGVTQICDEYHEYGRLREVPTAEAKIVLVPKDSRGPRIISCEPLEIQWVQQGLGNKIREHLESHKLTRGFVNFTDQSINRRLALESSRTQEWVTLDMKEASDRVSVELVNTIFGANPRLCEALYACRSDVTKLPCGHKHELRKFAPMGSNLCFPIEAFIFYSLCVGAIMQVYGVSRSVARRSVYVYGDDIIVRSKYYAAVLQCLPEYGLLFNSDKCCVEGFFRESCGCDAFKGVDVTPLRLKATWNHRGRLDARTISSYVGFANQLYVHRYYRTYSYVRALVECKLGLLPEVSRETSGLAWVIGDAVTNQRTPGVKYRFNKRYQRLEFLGFRVCSARISARADNWSTILRTLLCGGSGTTPGIYAVPRRSFLQRGWCPV